jgi:adenylate kinase
MTKYRTILIFGPPGSGKGTQGKTLGTLPGFFHCACGDVFRAIDTRTQVGAAFLEYSSKGQLVPDEITIQLWQARIRSCIETSAFKPEIDRLVLDGIPRNPRQAKLMAEVLAVERIFNLTNVSDAVIALRLQKRALKDNRLDDASDEVVRRRLEVHKNESAALLNCYPSNLITKIDATQLPYVVLCDILSSLMVWNGERRSVE